jgi:hypothetical protein
MPEPKRTTEMSAGWAYPGAARKAHFFPDRHLTALCGRWMFAGMREPEDGRRSPDDCVTCLGKLMKAKPTEQEPSA